jgi:hypothetical protein
MQPVRVYRILLGLHRCQRYDIAVVDERGMTGAGGGGAPPHPGVGAGSRDEEKERRVAVVVRGGLTWRAVTNEMVFPLCG